MGMSITFDKTSFSKKRSLRQQEKGLVEKHLRLVPLFKNLSDNYIKHLIDDFAVFSVKKNETVVFQQDEGTDLYLVLKGKVKAQLLDPEGNEFLLTTFGEKDFFGEMSLIDENPRSATVSAVEDSSIGILKRSRFLNAIKQNPMIAFELLIALTKRLRKADEMIEALAFLDVRERLLKYLFDSIDDKAAKDKNGFFRIKKQTHKELAARIGASREAVTKILKVLAQKKIIIEKDECFLLSPHKFKQLREDILSL